MINVRVNVHIRATLITIMTIVFSLILSWRRRKNGQVVTNCSLFDHYWRVMNLLAQVMIFFKCLRQLMIAYVTVINSGD